MGRENVLVRMCSILTLSIAATTVSCASQSAESNLSVSLPKVITPSEQLELGGTDGTFVVSVDQQIDPNAKGELRRVDLALPPFKRGVYMRAYTPFSGNRVSPIWFNSIEDILNFKPKPPYEDTNSSDFTINYGTFMMLELEDGRHLALLPLVGPESSASFMFDQNKLQIAVATHGDKPFRGELPVYAVGFGVTPYAASQAAWNEALALPQLEGMVQPRGKKEYPEVFKYLGWASWEAYRENINEKLMVDNFNAISDQSDLPVRWFLVDDGYVDATENKQLLSFGVDKQKFPNGWSTLTNLRNENKIKWFGIWRHMGGYMEGISKKHTMTDELGSYLVEYEGRLMPKPSPEANAAFYNAMAENSRNNGFDFQKIDFQSIHFEHYHGMPGINSVKALNLSYSAIEEAATNYGISLLNCMAQVGVNIFNSRDSAVMRNSMDFTNTRERANFTTAQSFINALWMSPVLFGDMDGFYSHDTMARRMAASRALSGGPFYIYDKPAQIDPTWIKASVYSDGQIVRPRAPAVALPDSLYGNVFETPIAFRAMAPLNNGAVAIQLLNLTEDYNNVRGHVSLADYPLANDLFLSDNGSTNSEDVQLFAFDFYNQTGQLLHQEEGISVDLPRDTDRFFLLVPVQFERAIIGLSQKFLSSQTYTVLDQDEDSVTLKVRDAGDFMVWSPRKTPKAQGLEFVSKPNGLWVAQLSKESKDSTIYINFERE